jgi:hypothetical protein
MKLARCNPRSDPQTGVELAPAYTGHYCLLPIWADLRSLCELRRRWVRLGWPDETRALASQAWGVCLDGEHAWMGSMLGWGACLDGEHAWMVMGVAVAAIQTRNRGSEVPRTWASLVNKGSGVVVCCSLALVARGWCWYWYASTGLCVRM